MKNFILLFLLSILIVHTTKSQCCPYMGDIGIIPEHPTSVDSVYLVTNVTTPNIANYLGYEIYDNADNEILVRSCYGLTGATALQDFTDTINLGIRVPGTYTVNFTAVVSNDVQECLPFDSNFVELILEVSASTTTNDLAERMEVFFYPNPIVTGATRLESNSIMEEVQVLSLQGQLLFKKTGLSTNDYQLQMSLYPSGIYFLRIIDNQGQETIKKMVKS